MLRPLPFPHSLLAISIIVILSLFSVGSCEILANGTGYDKSLLWGPYRPNLYFGVRPRIPKSLLAGLMWAKVDQVATVQISESSPVHECGTCSYMLKMCLST